MTDDRPNCEIIITKDVINHEYNDISQAVYSADYAKALSDEAERAGVRVNAHIKIDTGMGRIGLKYDTPQEWADEIMRIMEIDKIKIEGIYTHFAVADSDSSDNIAYTDRQEKFILDVRDILISRGITLPHVHFMNSAATCYRNSAESTLSRAGIILYGLHPDISLDIPEGLAPVMELKAVISQVKTVEAGQCISYGRTFTTDRKMRIATVTIGYADGYSRLLSSKGEILVHGKRCRIVGRVCMDQLMIDVSDVAEAKSGDIVTLIGKDGDDMITADELASIYGTIGYEVVCGISKRVPRIYIR